MAQEFLPGADQRRNAPSEISGRQAMARRQMLRASLAGGACACLAACHRVARGRTSSLLKPGGVGPRVPGMAGAPVALAAKTGAGDRPNPAPHPLPPHGLKPETADMGAATKAPHTAGAKPAGPNLSMAVFPNKLGVAIAHPSDAPVIIERRDQWAHAAPNYADMVLMNGINRMTIHHSGFPEPWETEAWQTTANEIEDIREFHTGAPPEDRGWADIAYHYVVDRAGRVWQARPLVYQGAHVRHHNAHNLGIVLLGNFDLQDPSAAQLCALREFVLFVKKLYRIPLHRIYTHRELADNHTDCPGTSLFAFVKRVRPSW